LSTELVGTCRHALAALTNADADEDWLAELNWQRPASQELHRDPVHGFMLLAHTECQGLYRPPHDHGRAWVVYGVHSGALEVRSYARTMSQGGIPRLVRRDEVVLRPGQAHAYLPGDIHDTRCVSESALLFRFTERDLRVEDQVDRQVTRYTEAGRPITAAGA
jgi:predicted metal-dependent enzyme (double-stranded beta helix superfamily)